MIATPKVGILSTIDSPILPFIMSALHAHGVRNLVAIVDQKTISEKDQMIWRERTGGALEQVPGVSLYALEDDAPPVYFVTNHNGDACLSLIDKLGITCLANAGTPRKLHKPILDSVKHGVINVHPGLLPKYRGCSCVEWAIYNDDQIGNTAHFMNEGYDEGPIILSECYEFPNDTDYRSIRVRTYRDGFMLMGKAVAMVLKEGMKPGDGIPQGDGTYWEPIPDDKMTLVLRKISAGQYPYASLES
jgi:methionyl-tRNA formyltransferase